LASRPCWRCRGRSSGRPLRTVPRGCRAPQCAPPSTTSIWSARRMVDSRCAMTKVVRPCHQLVETAWIMASDSESSELVASSRIRMRGSASKRTRNRQPLALAAGKLHAALAHNGVVGIGKALGKLVHARRAAGKQKLLLGGIGPREHECFRGWCRRRETSPAAPRPVASDRCSGPRLPDPHRLPARAPSGRRVEPT
jgi:hypothetical protein